MTTQANGPKANGLHYEVALGRSGGSGLGVYVVDNTGALPPRPFGTGERALREALWFARVHNGAVGEEGSTS